MIALIPWSLARVINFIVEVVPNIGVVRREVIQIANPPFGEQNRVTGESPKYLGITWDSTGSSVFFLN